MERKLEEIASEALRLSVESRAALAKRLLDSLDDLAPDEYERLWVEEAAATQGLMFTYRASAMRHAGITVTSLRGARRRR